MEHALNVKRGFEFMISSYWRHDYDNISNAVIDQ